MSLDCKIEPGQGIEWNTKAGGKVFRHTYLVVEEESSGFRAVPVFELHDYIKCYDDEGASYETDRDNVRLNHSPDVFTELRKDSERGQCFVYGNMGQARYISRVFLKMTDITVLDNGKTIDDLDMEIVKNHPWPHDLQQEKTLESDGRVVASVDTVRDISFGLDTVSMEKQGVVDVHSEDHEMSKQETSEWFPFQGSGWVQKALEKPGLPDFRGKTTEEKTGPNGPGD